MHIKLSKPLEFIFTLSLIFCLSACTGQKKKLEYGLELKETLRMNISTEPPSLDWHKSTDSTSAMIQYNIMDGLTEFDFDDPELGVIPALASSWQVTPDSKKWTFELRKDVTWTDGKPLVAQHFVDAFERLLSPATASQYAYFLFPVKKARAYNEGKTKDFSEVGVRAVEPHKLVIELENSMSFFPNLLTHHSTYPIRKDVVDKYSDAWTQPQNMQTLGAYRLKVWDHDKNIVLEANPAYYGTKPKVKNVLMYMINETSTAVNLFESGKLDVQLGIPSQELTRLKAKPEFKEYPVLVMQYIGFNVQMKPFDNPLIRKAFNHAIDRNQIVRLLGGGRTPLLSWVPRGMFGYEPEKGLKFDVEEAKRLLKQAGVKDPKELPKITYIFNTSEDLQRIAENVQAQLKKNLGVEIELKNEEWKVFLSTIRSNTPSMFRMGWQADFPDPDNFLNLMTSYSENNRTKWKNAAYDALIEKGAAEPNKAKRKEHYAKAQEILTETDAPVIPLFSSVSQSLVATRVKNFPLNSLSKIVLKEVELE